LQFQKYNDFGLKWPKTVEFKFKSGSFI
jgi:hypothetical protein